MIEISRWYAWYPVKTENDGWVWLEVVTKKVDNRPEYYQGLLPVTTYKRIS